MNVIGLVGGLGNQLFQYAFGQTLMLLGMDVAFDTSWYASEEANHPLYPRRFVLDKFQTNIKIHPFLDQETIEEAGFSVVQKIDNINFNGFWQYEKYWVQSLPILKEQIVVRKEFHNEDFLTLRKEIISHNSVSIHVRRGDVIFIPPNLALPAEYYQRALAYIKSHYQVDCVYIFSDDLPWCRRNFTSATFVDMDDYLCFELMRLCKYNILSYGSFSYWGARLNNNEDKVVIVANYRMWGRKAKQEAFKTMLLSGKLDKEQLCVLEGSMLRSFSIRATLRSYRTIRNQLDREWIIFN